MNFRTQIPIPNSSNPIDYNSRILSLGSCFAVNIGEKFDYFKFRNTTNPFGILFHPLALEKFIGFALTKKEFTETDIFYHNERWHCFDAHSDLSHPDKETLLANLNSTAGTAHEKLHGATHLIITLGTAWVYRNIESGNLVANCHKVPQKQFTKQLLSVEVIRQSLQNIIMMAAKANPSLHIIFTISPVRHIKDGFTENQWSKANLISALYEILSVQTENCDPDCKLSYFPSYEIMMDELRDYRFYAQDMIHPSQTAIDYIWERFTEAYITPPAQEVMQEAENIMKGLQHRPFNEDSLQHKEFVAKLNIKIAALQQRYPYISF